MDGVIQPRLRSQRLVLRELSTQVSNQQTKHPMVSDDESEGPVGKKTVRQEEVPKRKRGRSRVQSETEKTVQIQERTETDMNAQMGEETTGLSEYELLIQRNIAEKRKFLDSLGIFDVKKELDACLPCPVKKRIQRGITSSPKNLSQTIERRRSLRQQNLSPDGLHQTLPTEKPFVPEQLEEHPRPPPGPAAVTDYCRDHVKEACRGLLQELQGIVVKDANKKTPWTGNVDSVVRQMKKMVVREEHVVKVVPNRTFSIQIHPTMTKTLVLVGAKWGELGVWDVDREDESNGAHFFKPHSRPINCLTVDSTSPNHIYTTSYDGSVRRTDLEAGILQQVYSYLPEDDHSQWVSWHTHVDPHTLLVAATHGKIIKVDLRQDSKKPSSMFQVHNYTNVKVVTQHPMNSSYFASTGRDGNVCLWDVRKMRPNSPVSECAQRRQVSGLEFSPVTGNTLISTCTDDYLRFISCDLSSLTVSREIKHNNHTGRWLTPFKARFVPHHDDLIIVGSMRQPRRVEVWDSSGHLQHEFLGEHLGSVSSVVAMHPARPILAGANSSGRVSVFM